MNKQKWNSFDELMEQIETSEIQNKLSWRLWRLKNRIKQYASIFAYWFRCNHYFGWNKYHLIDCRNNDWKWGWRDQDERMLCGSFKCLEIFIEEEKGLEHFDWSERKEIKQEIEFLYDWWKFKFDLERDSVYENYSHEKVEAQEERETEMLVRLIKIRRHLWT